MSTSDIALREPWQAKPAPAPICRCDARDVVACRDEDGDWICCGCGRLVTASATTFRGVRAVALERMLLLG